MQQGDSLVTGELLAFVADQSPFAVNLVQKALEQLGEVELSSLEKGNFEKKFQVLLDKHLTFESDPSYECAPFETLESRLATEKANFQANLEGFFWRKSLAQRIDRVQKIKIFKGMLLTRAVDNTLKRLFLSGAMKYEGVGFQGKGFRSLGQEAIYAATCFMQKSDKNSVEGTYSGDVVAPLIRDLGVFLSFSQDDVLCALNAQVGKDTRPLYGRDLHVGDYSSGILPAAAPLAISVANTVGIALAFKQKNQKRVALSFIGEGGTSLGEWHESINMAAAQNLPAVFCVQNNQTALSTPREHQCRAISFGKKGAGYGVPHLSIDGTDPEAIAVGFAWGCERARSGLGPSLIELNCMRMCGHAHHDDTLYLGHDAELSFELPEAQSGGYVNIDKYRKWKNKDPILSYAQKLVENGDISSVDIDVFKKEAIRQCDSAVEQLKNTPWPSKAACEKQVFKNYLEPSPARPPTLELFEADRAGSTFLAAICEGIKDALDEDPRALLLGEDVASPYGNAFMLLKPILDNYGHKIINTPISENAIIGACVGLALEGLRPIGEMQFNDFVASGFNQLVNNAAKMHFRSGLNVPMVLRMPWGGLRRAGPYHSQDTSPWFYRTNGLKIVCPSTPNDAYALFKSAVADEDPVLFYEHIALYRDPKIKEKLDKNRESIPLGRAALRKMGVDLTLVSYGAYVHKALEAAKKLETLGHSIEVIDLRCLMPVDQETIDESVRKTGRLILLGEDSRRGNLLESLASQVLESCFTYLDAPIKVLGSLNTPVPYSPFLEDQYLLSQDTIIREAKALLAF